MTGDFSEDRPSLPQAPSSTGDAASAAPGSESNQDTAPAIPQLNAIQRRIVGVLVEKAKTTGDNLLTLNALTTGCNQKSNRSPKMNLDSDEVLLELDELCRMGAVTEVHGDGRVPKYRHRIYDWLDVGDKEAAIVAELLLRGPQTLGELRSRASRMASIPDMAALQTLLRPLIDRRIVVELTPPGRGQIVTHGLYLDREWDKVRESVATSGRQGAAAVEAASAATATPLAQRVTALEEALEALQAKVEELERRIDGS